MILMKVAIRHILYLVLLIGFLKCASQSQNMTYYYTDQNNNRFIISSRDISYFPTEPTESSSGVYDGGEEMKLKITDEAFKEISKLADSILKSSETHTSVRKMKTTVLTIKKDGNSIITILKSSKIRSDFEVILRKALH